ncbi:MDR family MFS transporter [Brevibacillus panacihumi]|uniref:MDR family MFS transporter n=1 Tax=Brevibacillus panacihumi TaxID=497735 RepID=UPI003D205ED1
MARFHPVVWSLLAGTFLSRVATYMTMPFLAIYLYKSKGMDADWIGAVIGISFLVGVASSFWGGMISDRYGRYPVMILALLGWALTFLGFAYAESPFAFFLISALNGFFRNIFEPVSKALLSDMTSIEEQATVFHARYLAINAGAALGPIAGVYLGSAQTAAPFFLTAGTYGFYLLIILLLQARWPQASVRQKEAPDETAITVKQALSVVISDQVFCAFLIGMMFLTAAYAQMESTLVQYMGSAPGFTDGVLLFSYLVTANTVAVLLLQVPVLRLARRFPAMKSLQLGTVLFALGLFGFGLFKSLVPLLFCMVLFTVGEILCFVMSEVFIQELAPEHAKGTYFGASGIPFLGQSIGPWFGGYLLKLLGFAEGHLVFGVLAGMTLLAIPLFIVAQSRLARHTRIARQENRSKKTKKRVKDTIDEVFGK